jgi:hypothetical protein
VAVSAARMKGWMGADLSALDIMVVQMDSIHIIWKSCSSNQLKGPSDGSIERLSRSCKAASTKRMRPKRYGVRERLQALLYARKYRRRTMVLAGIITASIFVVTAWIVVCERS